MKEIDRVLSTVRDIERTLIGLFSIELIIAITRLLVVNTKILTILAGVLVISVVVLLIVRRRLIKYYMKLIEMDPPDVNISPFGLIALIIGISVLIMLLLL